jgi:hypothetical protein
MDINITSPLTTTVSLTQNENIWSVLKYVALYAASGFAALLGVYLQGRSTHQLEKEKTKNLKIQKQWEVFCKLKGIQSALPQDYINNYQNGVFTLNQEAAARLHTEEKNQALHIEEARNLNARSHEIKRLFAKHRRELYETIGSILIFFPNKPKLHEKIDPIYSQLTIFESEFNQGEVRKELEVLIPGIFGDLKEWRETFDPNKAGENFTKIDDWKTYKINKINKLVTENVYQQLEDLLNYLQAEINDPTEAAWAKSWWQFWRKD